MGIYLLKRFLLIIPTIFGIMLTNFVITQIAPGGPVEQAIAQVQGLDIGGSMARLNIGSDNMGSVHSSAEVQHGGQGSPLLYQGAQGLSPQILHEIQKTYGFDKPPIERFFLMIQNYLTFDFGHSYFRDCRVIDLIWEKLPVSISLGFWSTLIIYLLSIPLGITKAVVDGTPFDFWSSVIIVVGYAVPGFLLAVLLIILFAGGSFWSLFPLRGLTSLNTEHLSGIQKILDYFWHMTLPLIAQVISGFASLTLLTKNSFLEEMHKQYAITARAKGLTERTIRLKHLLRNAMLVVVTGVPSAIMHIFFSGSFLIEVIFSLDGLGLLSFDAAMTRDYPVVFGTLYIFTLLSLILHIIGDVAYILIDPRINFDKRSG